MIPLGLYGAARPVSASGWSPADLASDLVAWYDAADSATLTASAGVVSQWRDKSDNAHHLAPWNTGPVTGSETQNGLNVVSFTADPMGSAVTSLAQPFTVAWVGKYGTAEWTPAVSLGADVPSFSIYHGGGTWLAYSGTALTTATAYDTSPHLFVSVHNGGSSSARLDAASIAAGNAGTNGISLINLGSANNAGGITGWLAEVVVATGALTGSDLANLEAYLADKWGI